ncbi:hypothetical protein [Paraburkholderia phytofirmans]|uniref:hypothetical protein n=1 Tax=Paraburkholderia phytofirmans TaxID=261302 RepID=UPI0011DFAE7E|nr:hypothetical protein [Paraburkholderia phytofirmans]
MISKLFNFAILTVAVFYYGSGPVRVLLYAAPEHSMLTYSAGIVDIRKIYRGAEYVTLREQSGLHKYHCGYYLWGLGVGFCPFEIRGGDKINGKDVVIGWYEQRSGFWGVSQKQIFEVSANGGAVLSFDSSVKYYEKQNSKATCSFLLVCIVIGYFFVLRRIFVYRK